MKTSSPILNVKEIELLYEINQQNIPELGSLDSADHLESLMKISLKTIVLKYFNNKYDKFIYVDRVVVASDFTAKGGGTLMYQDVFNFAKKNKLTVCCEVNEEPVNEVSLKFHKKLGFIKVSEKVYAKKKVAFLEKPPINIE